MSPLERRYRRLLRIYPAAHRAAYQEEMLGVLLAGSPPGRRFPGPGDALDLVRAGLTARFTRRSTKVPGTGWRDAIAVTALVVALLIAGFAVATCAEALLDRAHGVPRQLAGATGLLDPALRAVAWLAVAAAALTGRYRAAAAMSGLALLAEFGSVAFWLGLTPWQAMRLAWAPCMAILVATAFVTARTARPIREIVGGFGRALLVAAGIVPAAAAWAAEAPVPGFDDLSVWVPLALVSGMVIGIDPPVRRRVVLLVPAMMLTPVVFLQVWDSTVLPGSGGLVPQVVTVRESVLSLAPIVIVAGLAAGARFVVRRRGQVRVHE
ncbi:hypothetical protein BJY16_000691 [Actinoplanes octamycinicus]|uniref:Uncharacterized protein n=1 Tax=Actinoplanes octamycinicus TaxID=135948 RepID=A0A7W7GS20_9ACTN|nr:hypothetical protein [Actinoplanes octamycinicus]MBB4737232.1 hypothetical protein [Actinoplanes octamycinicus]GIE61948.1 hypothetical protein Aoc01nite_73500 [Actinoplanes octamycinicus]